MGGYDLKILHDGSKIEQARFTPRHKKESYFQFELSAQDTSTGEKLCRWSCVPLPPMMEALKMTPPILAAPDSAAELISRPHIEIIDPPNNKLGQEIKTKNNPGTRYGNEFGATLTSCGDTPDDPAELPSLSVPELDSDGNDSLTPHLLWPICS
jgi:hypothetical protein